MPRLKVKVILLNVALALFVAILSHFVIFPVVFKSSAHSQYFSELKGAKVKQFYENRSASCNKKAESFWDHLDRPLVVGSSTNPSTTQLLVMMISVKRKNIEFVKHTSKQYFQQVSKIGEKAAFSLCNSEAHPQHHTFAQSLTGLVAPINCSDRSHHCFDDQSW